MSSKMSKICDKSVFVIFRPINTHYCHSRGCTLQHNLHSVFSQRPCSPDTYFAMQCYSRVHYFAMYFSCIFNLKRIGSQVNNDDDFHNLVLVPRSLLLRIHERYKLDYEMFGYSINTALKLGGHRTLDT